MPDKRIKHFIFSRFFTYERRGYPYDIFDVTFLTKQLILAKNMLKSLENQTNKNFQLIFLTNPKFFDNPKYEFIFSALKYATTLPIKFIKAKGGLCKTKWNNELLNLLKESWNNYDFVITSRMDFDDFIFKDAVADTQSKVDDCDSILAYGYNRGYSYIYKELYLRRCTWWKETGHIGILQSLILKSSSVKKLPYFSVEDFEHPRIKPQLKQFLEKNGVEFSENMFQQNMTINAYIYFRHDFSQEQLVVHNGEPFKIPNRPPVTTKDITKKQLAEQFGFFHRLNSIE